MLRTGVDAARRILMRACEQAKLPVARGTRSLDTRIGDPSRDPLNEVQESS